jgi:hypothetical protein
MVAQVVDPAAEIDVYGPPCTCTGVPWSAFDPTPSCPEALNPQHHAVPDAVNPQL